MNCNYRICSYNLPSLIVSYQVSITTKVGDMTVTVSCGDIRTDVKAVAIVNCANSELNHFGGIAKKIAQAAGKELDEECTKYKKKHPEGVPTGRAMQTTSGKMKNCQYVIHAVGPNYKTATQPREELDDLLLQAYKSVFNLCHQEGFSSVATPFISGGK